MNVLNRYLFAQFVRNFLFVALAVVFVYLLIDFFEKIDNLTRAGKSIFASLQFFMFNVPFILEQVGPVLILLAGLLTLGVLQHNNELNALKAGGVRLRRVVGPIFLAGAAFTLIFLCMAQWMLPRTVSFTNRIWHEDVQGKVALGVFHNNRYYSRGREGFYSFERPDSGRYIFRNFLYSAWDEDYALRSLITAEEAEWKDNVWHLKNGQIQQRREKNAYAADVFQSMEVSLPESPEHFFIPEYRSAEMSLSELFFRILREDTESGARTARTDFFGRISYIFLGMPLLILGLPTLLFSCKRWGRDLSAAITISCGVAFVAWGAWGALQTLARAGYLSPFFAASAIHLLFIICGLVLLYKQTR